MKPRESWKVLVVDDEPEVHAVTAMVLREVTFRGRPIELIPAYTAADAMRILEGGSEIALILLDVVMESEHAGLELVRFVRRELKNPTVRIMLRTGQAGRAPEESVIMKYDINDYREKTELDARKLLTSVVASLRSYNDLMTIRSMNAELEAKVQERTEALEEANRRLVSSVRILEEDHKAGGMMQYRLLPKREQTISGYRFSRYLLPSMYLSGDFVDYFELRDGIVGFYIADVSGHGTSSAFVTVILKNLIDTRVEQYLARNDELLSDPARLMRRLNLELMRDKLGKYITIFFGLLDTGRHALNFVNCGHNPLPLLKTGESSPAYYGEPDRPLGMFGDFSAQNQFLTFPLSGTLLLVSDGILEVLAGNSQISRKETLRAAFGAGELSVAGLIDEFGLESIEELPDDITFLMIQRL